jgi:hypothetical protein
MKVGESADFGRAADPSETERGHNREVRLGVAADVGMLTRLEVLPTSSISAFAAFTSF